MSERIQAVRNRSISLLERKFLGLEFLIKVLMRRFLPEGAVLQSSERSKTIRDRSVSLLYQKSLVLGFLVEVLTRRSLLGGAVLI